MTKNHKNSLRRRGIVNSTGKKNKDETLQERIREINKAVSARNLPVIRQLAKTKAGFVDDGVRRRVWPKLLNFEETSESKKSDPDESLDIVHKDEYQVELDVERSLVNFSSAQREVKKDELRDVIVEILRKHPKLSYYQGFHDICSVLLLVLGKEKAIRAGENIAMFFLRDAMMPSLDLVLDQLSLVFDLVRLEDSEVAKFIETSGLMSHFCISWYITWCSHDIQDISNAARLFDFFIASNPLMPVYMAATIILIRREELLSQECEFSVVHSLLAKFPQHIDIEDLVSQTIKLYEKYSPDSLKKNAQTLLHESCCTNTYEKHWLDIKDDQPIDYTEAERILSLPMTGRKTVRFSNSQQSRYMFKLSKTQTITLVCFSAVVLYGCSRWLIRDHR